MKASSRQLLLQQSLSILGLCLGSSRLNLRDPSEQHGSSKPPLSSSAMTSRILLRQQLMREQLQEQERREQQKQEACHYPQTTAAQTPAINVSVPASLPPAAQVPMEVLKSEGQETVEIFLCIDKAGKFHPEVCGPPGAITNSEQ
ncbi:hypothetical protein NQZ68_019004 [Dissostichus eleginoides]|nr:hypothetical protein NQZ68_019004 [Dissostichus eleginoides]